MSEVPWKKEGDHVDPNNPNLVVSGPVITLDPETVDLATFPISDKPQRMLLASKFVEICKVRGPTDAIRGVLPCLVELVRYDDVAWTLADCLSDIVMACGGLQRSWWGLKPALIVLLSHAEWKVSNGACEGLQSAVLAGSEDDPTMDTTTTTGGGGGNSSKSSLGPFGLLGGSTTPTPAAAPGAASGDTIVTPDRIPPPLKRRSSDLAAKEDFATMVMTFCDSPWVSQRQSAAMLLPVLAAWEIAFPTIDRAMQHHFQHNHATMSSSLGVVQPMAAANGSSSDREGVLLKVNSVNMGTSPNTMQQQQPPSTNGSSKSSTPTRMMTRLVGTPPPEPLGIFASSPVDSFFQAFAVLCKDPEVCVRRACAERLGRWLEGGTSQLSHASLLVSPRLSSPQHPAQSLSSGGPAVAPPPAISPLISPQRVSEVAKLASLLLKGASEHDTIRFALVPSLVSLAHFTGVSTSTPSGSVRLLHEAGGSSTGKVIPGSSNSPAFVNSTSNTPLQGASTPPLAPPPLRKLSTSGLGEEMAIPTFLSLCKDESWRVRFICAKNLSAFVSVSPAVASAATDSVVQLSQDEEVEVRASVASQIGDLAESLTKAATSSVSISAETGLLGTAASGSNSPSPSMEQAAATAGRKDIEAKVFDITDALSTDASEQVKNAAVNGMTNVCRYCVGDHAKVLLERILQLVKSGTPMTQATVISALNNLGTNLEAPGIAVEFAKALSAASTSKQWRVRQAVAEQYRRFVFYLPISEWPLIAQSCEALLQDPIASVRVTMVASLPHLAGRYGVAWTRGMVGRLIERLLSAPPATAIPPITAGNGSPGSPRGPAPFSSNAAATGDMGSPYTQRITLIRCFDALLPHAEATGLASLPSPKPLSPSGSVQIDRNVSLASVDKSSLSSGGSGVKGSASQSAPESATDATFWSPIRELLMKLATDPVCSVRAALATAMSSSGSGFARCTSLAATCSVILSEFGEDNDSVVLDAVNRRNSAGTGLTNGVQESPY